LSKNSHVKVKVRCDYCQEVFKREYRYIERARKVVAKDSCSKCSHLKTRDVNMSLYGYEYYTGTEEFKQKKKDTNIKRYGTENPLQNEDVKAKSRETIRSKYGVDSYTQTQEYKDKVKKTSLEKYGVEHHGKSSEIVNKRKQTTIERYGVENVSQLEFIKNKKKDTLQKNYGVDVPAQSQIVRNLMKATSKEKYGFEYPMQASEVKEKLRKTLADNNLVKTSLQQKIIHHVIGGVLNYPYYTANLDIAFPEDKIYIEYNGGGHWLRVKFGHFTEEEFKQFERNRWYSLYRNGWKDVRITSKADKLPKRQVVLSLIKDGLDILNNGRSWVEFDIDNNEVKTSQYTQPYNFGELLVIRRDRGKVINNEYGYNVESK